MAVVRKPYGTKAFYRSIFSFFVKKSYHRHQPHEGLASYQKQSSVEQIYQSLALGLTSWVERFVLPIYNGFLLTDCAGLPCTSIVF